MEHDRSLVGDPGFIEGESVQFIDVLLQFSYKFTPVTLGEDPL